VAKEAPSRIGALVKAPFERLMEAREKLFYKLAAADGSVSLSVEECGANIRFKKLSEFPKENMACLCKNPNHFMVKFELE